MGMLPAEGKKNIAIIFAVISLALKNSWICYMYGSQVLAFLLNAWIQLKMGMFVQVVPCMHPNHSFCHICSTKKVQLYK